MMDSLDRLRAALADRYTVERELGRGGTATVCLATDLRHDRAVTLKVLNPDLGVVIGPERLLREIQTTARLTHPHILPLLDSGDTDGALFYVMPYPPGKSLRKGSRRRSSQRWTTHSYHAMPVLAKSGVLPWANVWGVSFVGADLYGVTTLGPPLECQSGISPLPGRSLAVRSICYSAGGATSPAIRQR